MIEIKDLKFAGAGSHFITLGAANSIEREEVYLYFSGSWRGQAIRFNQCCKRTTQYDKDAKWQHYVETSANNVIDDIGSTRTTDLTDPQRQACDRATDLLVDEWLISAEGKASSDRALANAILRVGHNQRYEPWVHINRAVSAHHVRLSEEITASLTKYASALFEADFAREGVTRQLDQGFNNWKWETVEVIA